MFQRILVAVEPTSAPTIVPQAVAIAKVHGAQLLFVYIRSTFDENYTGSFYPGVDTLYPTLNNPVLLNYAEEWAKAEARSQDWLKALAAEATLAGVSVTYRQQTGDPGMLLCQIAQDDSVDLILVGRRGRSGLSEMLLGSVSNYVMHHAPCSVLTLQGSANASSSTVDTLKQTAQV
ncbi:MAG: universal stress protein [Alkalinema sp. RL_2_19]|nr:universal stress protein [Alkalinema sp. RL_2_19]